MDSLTSTILNKYFLKRFLIVNLGDQSILH